MVGIKMTPIKIPGKNNRDQRRSTIAASHNKRSRPPGRPPKISLSDVSGDSIPVISDKSATHRSLKNLKPSRKMAKLEKLPTEILTSIFLFSMNLDLPRASPIMAGKLSSRLAVLEAVTNAFSPTWEYYYELVKGHRQMKSQVPGDPELQSAILRCKCATFLVLKQAEVTWLHGAALQRGSEPISDQIYSKLHAQRSIGLNHMGNCGRRLSYRSRQKNPDDYFVAEYISRWRHKITDDCFIEDYAEFRQLSTQRIVKDMSCDFKPRWTWTSFLHLHPQFDIPESLLQGPWTADMVEYLFWLIRAEANIEWTNSTNGEVALLGLKNAISTGNLQILYIFRYLGLAQCVTQKMMEWAFDHAGGDKVEVIARLMRMLLCGRNVKYRDPAMAHLELAGALSRRRRLAEQENDRGEDRAEAIALVKGLENYLNSL